MRRSVLLLASAFWVVPAGCKTGEPAGSPPSTAVANPAVVAVDPATLGVVSGAVRFEGTAPKPLAIDTSMDPACGLGGGGAVTELYAVKDGKLGNVFVYVKSGPEAAMKAPDARAAAPVVLDQKGCVYAPHVIGVMRGGSVAFHNDDSTMHNIHTMPAAAGNAAVDVSQGPRGAPQVKRFDVAETMMPVRCNNHPWMNAFINVSATPFFAVTDAAGRFDLHDLPAGEYTIGAVQERLGERTMQVAVKARETTRADFAFSGTATN